eukprot:7604413-Karenia_brevis.AAC.1
MERASWNALKATQSRLARIVKQSQSLKVSSRSLGDLLHSSSEDMEIFVPKGTKRSKCMRSTIMLLYVKMLRAAHELDDVLKSADVDLFVEEPDPDTM